MHAAGSADGRRIRDRRILQPLVISLVTFYTVFDPRHVQTAKQRVGVTIVAISRNA
jgi:hypothetical protein